MSESSRPGANASASRIPIAIIGMSCIFPGAPSLKHFWQNIINGVDATRDPDEREWNAEFFRNKSDTEFGRVYCTRGGFITDYAAFDPLEFGIMPSSVRGADPDQWLILKVAAEALANAGYSHRKKHDFERGDIIIGRTMAPGVGSLNLIQHGQTVDQVVEILEVVAPGISSEELDDIARVLKSTLEPCNSDTIPAVMPNVMAGRIASKLGFRGRNLILDAACASSLIALEMAIDGLVANKSDIAIAGGVHVSSSAGFSQMFCGVKALSHSGVIRPFDDDADGTVLGEGVAAVVLKRLEDALRDGDRIYALVRGIGSSSDGRSGGLLSPNVDGEVLAMKRAYEAAGVSPRSIELIEAHGTATRAGDRVEMKAIQQVFSAGGSVQTNGKPWCAIGSVKSMIGHTQAASGMAGLIKAAMALHTKVLPPTINVTTPNSEIDWKEAPCYINHFAKNWERPHGASEPRRAAVSAFGFGGVNAHAILEEWSTDQDQDRVEESPADAQPKRQNVSLSLRFPYFAPERLQELELCTTAPESWRCDDTPCNENVSGFPNVVQTFVRTLSEVHQNSLATQENVMLGYLECSD